MISRPQQRPGHGAGLALAVVSAATFGTSGTFGSALIGAGWSPAAAVLARITLAAVLLTVPAVPALRGMLAREGGLPEPPGITGPAGPSSAGPRLAGRWGLLRRHAGAATAFGLIAVAGCQLCYFNAIQRMPVGVALLLEYLGVVLVVGWLWLRHGQRPRRLTVLGGAAAIAGLACVLDLSGPGRISPLGVMWGLLAAVGLAIFFLLSAHAPAGPGAPDPLPPIVMAWAGMCVGAVALGLAGWAGLAPLTAPTGPVTLLHHQVSWLVPVIGLALVAAVVPYVAGIGAARRLGAKLASFIGLAEVLFAILFAWLLLGQLPSPVQFLGGALILAGVTAVRVDELRGAPAAAGARPGPVPDGAGPGADAVPDAAGPREGSPAEAVR